MKLQTKWDANWVSNSERLVSPSFRRCKRGMDQNLHMRVRDRHHTFCLSSGRKDLAVWVIFPLNPFVRLRPRNSAGENVISINNALGTGRQSPVWSPILNMPWQLPSYSTHVVLHQHARYSYVVWYKMQDGREANLYNSKRSYPTSPFVLLAFSIHQQFVTLDLPKKNFNTSSHNWVRWTSCRYPGGPENGRCFAISWDDHLQNPKIVR